MRIHTLYDSTGMHALPKEVFGIVYIIDTAQQFWSGMCPPSMSLMSVYANFVRVTLTEANDPHRKRVATVRVTAPTMHAYVIRSGEALFRHDKDMALCRALRVRQVDALLRRTLQLRTHRRTHFGLNSCNSRLLVCAAGRVARVDRHAFPAAWSEVANLLNGLACLNESYYYCLGRHSVGTMVKGA